MKFLSHSILLLISISTTFSYNCDVYRCAYTNNYYLDPNTCVGYHKNAIANIKYFEIDISHCKSTQYCPTQLAGTEQNLGCYTKPTKIDPAEPTTGLDTDDCVRDIDCKSKNCSKDKKCVGKGSGETCTYHNVCKIGFYCKKIQDNPLLKQCQPQVAESKACAEDLDCLNNMGCLGKPSQKICLKYYSLKDHAEVYEPSDRRFCQSNFMMDNMCVSHKLTSNDECIGSQSKCNYTYQPPAQSTPKTFQQDCLCSATHFDKQFCPLATNSSKWVNMVKAYQTYYSGDVLKKHTVLRNFYTKDVIIQQYEVEKYPAFKDADKCYRDFMTSGFYLSKVISGILFVISMFLI